MLIETAEILSSQGEHIMAKMFGINAKIRNESFRLMVNLLVYAFIKIWAL